MLVTPIPRCQHTLSRCGARRPHAPDPPRKTGASWLPRSPPGSVRVGGRAGSAARAGQALTAVSIAVQVVPSAFILTGDTIESGTGNHIPASRRHIRPPTSRDLSGGQTPLNPIHIIIDTV